MSALKMGAMNVLENVTKWGVNASPFQIAKTYLSLNWSGIKFFFEVSKASEQGKMLDFFVDGLEQSARPQESHQGTSLSRVQVARLPATARSQERFGTRFQGGTCLR